MQTMLKDVAPHLLDEWDTVKNIDLDLGKLKANSSTKVWWKCLANDKHRWRATVRHRVIDGYGCPYCSGRRVLREDSFGAKYPDLVKELHPKKNGDLDPFSVRPFSNKIVWWLCPQNPKHEWKRAIGGRVKYGSGCRQCNRLKNSLKVARPDLANEWHPKLNKDLSPEDVPASSGEKVWWQCSHDPAHVWERRIDTRTRFKSGCPHCNGRKKSITPPQALLEYDPGLAKEWHPTKNGILTPSQVTPGMERKVWWLCSVDPSHEWEASIRNRAKRGTGCRFCAKGGRAVAPGKSLADKFPEVAREWHPTKNKGQQPTSVSFGSAQRVWWQCEKGHEWDSTVTNRTSKASRSACPFCSGARLTDETSLATCHPEIAKDWHPTKNADITPNKVSRASGRKVWWLCSKNPNHEWQAVIKNRTILGSGCRQCEEEKRAVRFEKLFLESSQANAEYLLIFQKTMNALRRMAKHGFPDNLNLKQPLYRMLHSSTVTALETYLSDAFCLTVLNSSELIEKLVLSAPEFRDRKYALTDVISWHKNTRQRVTEYFQGIVWHNLPKVREMYKSVLEIEFPQGVEDILRAIVVRHDIVHRNGRTKGGKILRLSLADIEGLFEVMENFVGALDARLKEQVFFSLGSDGSKA